MNEDEKSINPEEEIYFATPPKRVYNLENNETRGDWVEEVFLDGKNTKQERHNNFMGLSLSRNRLNITFFVAVFFLLILLAKTFWMQVGQVSEYRDLAEKNRIRIHYIQSPRGVVYDRNGVALVKNIPDFALYLTPVDFLRTNNAVNLMDKLKKYYPDDAELAADVEKILSTKNNRKEYYLPHIIVRKIDYQTALKIKLDTSEMAGISVDVNNEREYLFALGSSTATESLSHLLGYVGKVNDTEYEQNQSFGYLYNDNIGKAGIERVYEKALRGQYGQKQVEVDSFGREKKIVAEEKLISGNNIYLTLDAKLQSKMEEILRNTLAKNNLKKAIGIAMDPRNGDVLAMVSLPTYNNNEFGPGMLVDDYAKYLNDPDQPLFNRAISGEYPSGSVIKPVIASAALQEKIVTATTSFLSNGGIRIDQWFFPDWKAGGHGMTDVRKAIADSVNTYFYIVGGGYGDQEGLGIKRIKEYALKFGLMAKTGIDLPGERAGFIPDAEWKWQAKKEQWYIGDTYHAAIGQGDVVVTPIQVANYICAIANNGFLYKPHLLKQIYDVDSKTTNYYLPEVINSNFIDQDNLKIVREGMRQSVTRGSSRRLNYLPIEIAGKTGTAQWGLDKPNHAWFTSFAPYNDPQIVVTILFEEGVEGSTVAVPAAEEFYKFWYYNNYKK